MVCSDETTDNELSNTVNGKPQVSSLTNTDTSRLSSMEHLSFQSTTSLTDNQNNESQAMQLDEGSIRKSPTMTIPSETP